MAFFLPIHANADSGDWTFRLRIINPERISELKGRNLELSDLESITKIVEISVHPQLN